MGKTGKGNPIFSMTGEPANLMETIEGVVVA